MISKYALILAEHYAGKNVYTKEKINVYTYGFELLISTVLNILGILLISLITGTMAGAAFFCIAFIPLRLAAGGYHANHHWTCILGFNLIFLGVVVLYHYINIEYILPYSLIAIIVSALFIWSFAPVEAVNKPLKAVQREIQRNKSIIIACVNLALILILLFYSRFATDKYTQFLVFYSSGVFAASLSLVVAAVINCQNRNFTGTVSK